MLDHFTSNARARSAALIITIDARLYRILMCWVLVVGAASTARVALTPHVLPLSGLSNFSSYMLLATAPIASTLLALRWFAAGHRQSQPQTRLARVSRWTTVGRAEAERHPLYGTGGIMVSLLVGMMVNVPVRAAEYLAALPPMPEDAPPWLSTLHFAMTFDAVVFSSLYMIAFVAALRRVPLFPRLLVAIWLGDLAMQLVTAQLVAGPSLPQRVAGALQTVLTGNIEKVLISMALWLPYLLLSTRVNVTYRHRVPA